MTEDNGTDWMWCYEHPREAADEITKLRAALEPFAAYSRTQKKMGGNSPKTGPLFGLQTGTADEAELTVEHFRAAEAAIGKP